MFLGPVCITLHFETLNFICQSSAHLHNASRSSCSWSLSAGVMALPKILESSANLSMELKRFKSRSFMKIKNSSGPRQSPVARR